MLFKRGNRWWYEFSFGGARIRESAKTASKSLARNVELKRKRDLESGVAGLKRREVRLFRTAAADWLSLKRHALSPRSVKIEEANLVHVLPYFGGMLTSDIEAKDLARYQQKRLEEKAAGATINLEIGTVRAILRRAGHWAAIQPEVKMLSVRDDVGRALTQEEEKTLLGKCRESRSRALLPAVLVALNTGLRYGELVGLRWRQVDLEGKTLTVGTSKTEAGAGRRVPLNDRAFSALSLWADRFPKRKPEHYVFPTERYGQPGEKKSGVYDVDPTKPVGRLKEAWEKAKERAKVSCRWHDLRHTFCTRLLEAGHGFPLIAQVMGWSPATTVRMAKRYGHVSTETLRPLVGSLDSLVFEGDSPQNHPQSAEIEVPASVN
jgi:integrase